MKIKKLNIPKTLMRQIVGYYRNTYTGVIPPSYKIDDFSQHRLDSVDIQMKRLKSLGVRSQDKCLDAGCGIGTLVTLGNLSGYNYYGYEIDPKAARIAKNMLIANGISPNKIRLDPNFKTMKFDFISSFEVVEHVNDLKSYLTKLRKLIKPNGRLFMEMPNYLIPYEPHFYFFMPPGPKVFRQWCCKLAGGTNMTFFDELRFVTPTSVERDLQKAGFNFKNLGRDEWIDLLSSNSSPERSSYVQLISKWVKTLKLRPLVKLAANMGIYTPLVYQASPKNN